nr:HEPN domain-containing protein [uncultured Rhodopila sp.]
MKNHILSAHNTFKGGCDRAEGLRAIYEYMRKTAPAALNCDDILRSALVLAVSSFDLFIHDLFRCEITHRLGAKREVISLRVPFNVLISSEQSQIDMIDASIRKENSYKSFVAPDKLADCLRILVENPWEKIAHFLSDTVHNSKENLKMVVDLRNRIAHEADVNPAFGGVELWPIYSEDVESSIVFLRRLGGSIAMVIDNH